MMIGSCYFSLCAPAFLQGSLREPAQNKCYSVRPSLARGCCVSTRKDSAFISPKWGSVLASVLNFSKKWVVSWGLHETPKQPSSYVLERLACEHAEPAPPNTGFLGGSTHLNLDSQMQARTAELSFHVLGIPHSEAPLFSFLGWVILSLCQMLSVTSLKELLGPLASLSVSHKELHKQSTAVLAYGYHHSAPKTS